MGVKEGSEQGLDRMNSYSTLTRQRTSRVLLVALLLTFIQYLPTLSSTLLSPAQAGIANPSASTPNPQPALASGAYIIDAGHVTSGNKQTIAEGLKPYGLIYALVKSKIPVEWVINPNKSPISQLDGNSGDDFIFDCDGAGTAYTPKHYKSGAFVITADFAAQAKPIVDAWKAQGVFVDGQCSNSLANLPVFGTIKSWPRIGLDAQNGAVAQAYFVNAGIPQGSLTDPLNPPAYRFVAPSALTPCDDMYVMPHADPTYATHSNLINFVKAGGDFYASCHAVSVVENMTNGTNSNKVMNFLSTNGLVNYDAHSQGSPKYTIYDTATVNGVTAAPSFSYTGTYVSNYVDNSGNFADTNAPVSITGNYTLPGLSSGDPMAQFLGVTDAAQQQGSEQIFMPAANSRWRPTTQVVVYDETQTNTPNSSSPASGFVSTTPVTVSGSLNSPGPAASVLFGPAFGNSSYGQVMYVGGHTSNKGTVDDVATQRLFFNFQLLTSIVSSQTPSASDRSPTVTINGDAFIQVESHTATAVSGSAIGGSGVYRYQWSSSCYNRDGSTASGNGTFASASSPSTTFTTPDISSVANCNLTLTAIDSCGRFSFGFVQVAVVPKTDIRIAQTLPATGTKGTTFNSTIVVTNIGSQVAAGVKVLAAQPLTGTYGTATTSVSGTSCSIAAGVLTCDLGDLAPGATVTITLPITPTASGSLANSVRATTLSVDVDSSNNSDADVVNVSDVAPATLMSIKKEPAIQQVTPGGVAAFRITVSNISTNGMTIDHIIVTDTFTTGGTLSCSGTNGQTFGSNSGVATADIGSLDPGESWMGTCEIAGVSADSGSNSFSAASSTTGVTGLNSNGSPSENTTVNKVTSLTLSKSITSKNVSPGKTIYYQLVVTNNTGDTKTGISFNELLPKGLTYVPGSASVQNTMPSGGGSTKTAKVLLKEKFDTSTVGASGTWVAAKIGSGGDINSASISSNKLQISPNGNNETYTVTRNVYFDNNVADAKLYFDYWRDDQSDNATLSVSLNGTIIASGLTYSSSRTTVSPISIPVTSGMYGQPLPLTFIFKGAGNGNKKYLDDIYLISGAQYFDEINSSLPTSAVTKSDGTTLAKSSGSSGGGGSSGGSDNVIKWQAKDSNSLSTGKYAITLPSTLDSTKVSNAKISFTYGMDSTPSNATKSTVWIQSSSSCDSSTALIKVQSSTSSIGSTSGSSSNPETNTAFNIPESKILYMCFSGASQKKAIIDDIIITASPLGTSTDATISTDPATALLGTYSLKNTGTLTLTFGVKIPDPYVDPSMTGIYNLASVTSTGQANPVYGDDSSEFDQNPLVLTKTVDTQTILSGSSTVPRFTYTLHNTGGKVYHLTFTDNGCTSVTYNNGALPTSIDTNTMLTFSCLATDTTTASLQGLASATVYDDPDTTVANVFTKTAELKITILDSRIGLTATPTSKNVTSGGTVTYTYHVTAPGTANLMRVNIHASNCSSITYVSGDSDGDGVLRNNAGGQGETWVYQCTTGPQTVSAPSESVTVTAVNTFNAASVTSSPISLAVTVATKPVLHLTKSGRDGTNPAGTSLSVLQNNHVYFFDTVTVTGANVSSVSVIDDSCNMSGVNPSGDVNSNHVLEVGETWVYTCDAGTLPQSETSTTVVSATAGDGTTIQSDPASVYVFVADPAALITVDPAKEYVLANTTDLFTYTVTNTGGVPLTGFTGSDPKCSTPITFGLIPVGESRSMTCSYVIPSDTMTVFSGVATSGYGNVYPDTATAQVFALNPRFNVVKKGQAFPHGSSTPRTDTPTVTINAQAGDDIIFTYELSAETGTGASLIDGLNSIFKADHVDPDCVVGGMTSSVDADGYNIGDTNHNGFIDPLEVWIYTCQGVSSLTASYGGALRMGAPLPKVSNGGLNAQVGHLNAGVQMNSANDVRNTNSPVTFTALSSLDTSSANAIVTLTGSATAIVHVEGVTNAPPSSSPTPNTTPDPGLLSPKITWPTPNSVTGPYALSPTELNATCSVDGSTMTYSPALGAVLQPGTYTLTVTCNPPANSGYGPISKSVTFVVNKPGTVTPAPTPKPSPKSEAIDPPTQPTVQLASGTTSNIAWQASPNATGYYVTIAGKTVCTTTGALQCLAHELVGPKSVIKIYATKGALTSTYVRPTLLKNDRPQIIGMVYFNSASYLIKQDQRPEILRVARLIKKLGYDFVYIQGHTDSNAYDNVKLSNDRAVNTLTALTKLLPGLGYKLDYHGATSPIASNSTLKGQALNRRAEIAVW